MAKIYSFTWSFSVCSHNLKDYADQHFMTLRGDATNPRGFAAVDILSQWQSAKDILNETAKKIDPTEPASSREDDGLSASQKNSLYFMEIIIVIIIIYCNGVFTR